MSEKSPLFQGYIKHFNGKSGGIMVDNFYGEVVQYYFISHAHTDHLDGLRELQACLSDRRNQSVIFCTEETGKLILAYDIFDSEILGQKFVHVGPGKSVTLGHQGRDSNTKVTFVDANHIPGSVMILFEDDRYKALYTGDMRFEFYERTNVIENMRNFLARTPDIDFLYLDVQFLDLWEERHLGKNKFPSKRVVLKQLVKFVRRKTMIEQNYDSVHVDCSSLGWQDVAGYLATEFHCPIGITKQDYKRKIHKNMVELIYGFDNVPFCRSGRSFLHIFSGPSCKHCTNRTLRIKPSVIWSFYFNQEYSFYDRSSWIQEVNPQQGPDFYNVLFSSHSSNYELLQFLRCVNFSRRGKVFPINRPFGERVKEMSNKEIRGKVAHMFRDSGLM